MILADGKGARKVGTFEEIKGSKPGGSPSSSFLAYLGDASIECNVHAGAGVISCDCSASPKKTATNSTNYHEGRIVWLASREIILRRIREIRGFICRPVTVPSRLNSHHLLGF